jgi:MraZ protein
VGESAVFHGESVHGLDAKFRLVVPKRIQDHLGRDGDGRQTCILTRGLDRCIYLFPKEGFTSALSKMRLGAFTGEEQRAVQRVLLSSTFELELDGSGRVLVPEKLRPQLGDERELVVLGNDDHAEIWGRQEWERYQSRNEGLLDRIDRILGGSGEAT